MPLQATFLGAPDFAALQAERPPLIIDPWLASGSVTLLFGPPSAGKTHLTISMARAIAHGEPVWGMFPTQKSRVLVVQADMNTALYQERIRPNADVLGSDVAVLATDAMPFDIMALKPSDPVIAAVNRFAPGIIFVDTLRKSHNLDENDSDAPDKVYSAWRMLFPGAAFVFLHHSRKVSADAGKNADLVLREAFRGSGAWAASADTIIMQRRVRKANNPAWMTRVMFVRTRSCQEPSSVLLKLSTELMLTPIVESGVEKALLEWVVANPKAPRSEAIRWLQHDGEPGCSTATAYRIYNRVMRGDNG